MTPIFNRTAATFLALCLAAAALLALARGCTLPSSPTQPAPSAPPTPALSIIGLADREIVKAQADPTDPALLEKQLHDQAFRDAWLRTPAYTQGVRFELLRAHPQDPPHITFAPLPLPSRPPLAPAESQYASLETGLTRGLFTFTPADSAALQPPPNLRNAPLYKVVAGYPITPGPAPLPIMTIHDLAIQQCYREAIKAHLAATHQDHALHLSGRILPVADLRTWPLDVPAGQSAPGETSTLPTGRRLCRMEMSIHVLIGPVGTAAASARPAVAAAPPAPTPPVDHAARGCPVTLATPFLPNYSGGGPNALTDGLLASSITLDDPAWQGVQGDLDAVIDLGRTVDVRVLCARFYQHADAAIIFPAQVEYSLSSDGKDFHSAATVTNGISPTLTDWIKEYWAQLDAPRSARFVRVHAAGQPGANWIFSDEILVNPLPRTTATEPIRGTWMVLSFPHATTEDWQKSVADCAALGMQYLAIHCVAMNGQAFYASDLLPRAKQDCPDALEAVLAAADSAGLKVFVSNGFTGPGQSSSGSPAIEELRRNVTREIARKYSAHPSFYGWYWPDEASIREHFPDDFAAYIKDCSALARQLTPRARIMIAPYGTRLVADDEKFRDQLRHLDVDIIAYQDEVGCNRAGAYDDYWIFRRLAKIHRDVPNIELWAQLESFDLQGPNWTSPDFPRVQAQIESLSPFVSNIIIYRYTDTMGRAPQAPGTPQKPPYPLLRDYRDWLTKNHPPALPAAPK